MWAWLCERVHLTHGSWLIIQIFGVYIREILAHLAVYSYNIDNFDLCDLYIG